MFVLTFISALRLSTGGIINVLGRARAAIARELNVVDNGSQSKMDSPSRVRWKSHLAFEFLLSV